jgi:hypothetical protein
MKTQWIYCNLVKGRLVDDEGYELNPNWPSFQCFEDAERFLEDEDIRATLR